MFSIFRSRQPDSVASIATIPSTIAIVACLGAMSLCELFSPAHAIAQSRNLEIAEVSAPAVNCVFDSDCRITVNDTSATIASTGGSIQSRRFAVAESGTPAAGLYGYNYRVNLSNAVEDEERDCVWDVAIPFGPIEPLDYDGDGELEHLYDLRLGGGAGNVRLLGASQEGDTVYLQFEAFDIFLGVCQGNFPGDGDSSYFVGMASRYPDHKFAEAELDFWHAPNERVEVRVPDLPSTRFMEDYAFAWAYDPTASSYTANPGTGFLYRDYSYNRADGPITIERSGVGAYRVTFAGMENRWAQKGNVQVTAYGQDAGDAGHCNAVDWGTNWADVRCFGPTGTPRDSQYTILMAKPMPIREGLAHARIRSPWLSAYSPAEEDAFNPSDGSVEVTRTSVGRYRVQFLGFGTGSSPVAGRGGNVQVTSMGTSGSRCHVTSWGGGFVNVRCDDAFGSPVDSRFSVLYLDPKDRFDRDVAYAWSNHSSEPHSYVPSETYLFNPEQGPISIERTSMGRYDVRVEGFERSGTATTGGQVFVNAYGGGSEHCAVDSWGDASSSISCHDAAGALTDVSFSIMHLRPTPVPEPTALALTAGGVLGLGALGHRRSRSRRRVEV